MKKHEVNFKQDTSIENLNMEMSICNDAVITFGFRVIVAHLNWRGQYEAAIYECADDEIDIESRLELIEIADEVFKDNGHAIAWGLSKIR